MLAIVVACFTLQDIRNHECAVYCRTLGYESGFYAENSCQCVDPQDYTKLAQKKLTLPKRAKRDDG